MVGKHNLTAPASSYSRPDIVAKSQSYFFTHSVKAITVTLTAKGITSKQLLIGTIGDQVGPRFFKPDRIFNVQFGSIYVALLHFCVGQLKPAEIVQVLALDKRYLDPRRSLNPSQAEKEEGVIPLTDSLPIIPQVCNFNLFRPHKY